MSNKSKVDKVAPQKYKPHVSSPNEKTLQNKQLRKYALTLGFCASCVWNLAAPLKAWLLSQYGFSSTTDTKIVNLKWDTVINGRFLTKLYENAGILLSKPMDATQYINVFVDFIVSPRSTAVWAKSYINTEGIYQMDLDGRCLRYALDGPREVNQFNIDISKFQDTGFSLWGGEIIHNYVPPVIENVALHEVTEALLCLKGISLEDYVNLQYISQLQPYGNSNDKAAIAMWQSKLFKNLSACLLRRFQLVHAADKPEDGLVALAHELAIQYNLTLDNIAGNNLLYSSVMFHDGFVDLSGLKSGSVTYAIRSIYNPRETAWYCSIAYVDPATKLSNATQCFEKLSTTLPAFFLGKYLTLLSGSRYLDSFDFIQGATTRNITAFSYKKPKLQDLNQIEYAQAGNLSSWNDLFKQLIAVATNQSFVQKNALEELCLVGDGCFSSCMNASASGGMTLTYKRSGTCVSSVDTVAHGLTSIFADVKCFGLGSGSSNVQVTYLSTDGTRQFLRVNNTATPVAILVCMIGGRLPYTDYPSYLVDMLDAGTQASLVMTKSNGSEAIILNFIALMSLTGYGYFFIRISIYLYRTAQWVGKMPRTMKKDQMLYSIVNCSISSVIWSHYRTSMTSIGFLGLIAYHIGASSSSCQWDQSIVNIAQDALYTCHVDVFGHFSSLQEIIRLFSYSWVFYALVYMDRMPGIAIYTPGYIVAAFLLGLIPFSILTILVAKICQLRLQSSVLFLIHNQLFLVLTWCTIICILRTKLSHPYLRFVEKCLALVGVRKQPIASSSPFRVMLGDHYWIESTLLQNQDATYIPLSVLMETSKVKLSNIHDHQYFVFGVDDKPVPCEHPSWIASQLEYYICVPRR